MGRRKPPRPHTVYTKDPRYHVTQYGRGSGETPQVAPPRSPSNRVSPETYNIIKRGIIANYPSGEHYPDLAGIAIFGSQAYGSPRPDSDIDVLVVADTKERLHGDILKVDPALRRTEKSLSEELGREVEITSMPRRSTWEDFLTRKGGMDKQTLIQKSIWIHDPHRYFTYAT